MQSSAPKGSSLKTLLLSFLLTCLAAVGAAGAFSAPATSLRVTGTIVTVGPGSLQLAASGGTTMTFRLVATTTFVEDGQPAGLSALAAGESALVKYHQEPDGSLKAKEVKVESPTGPASAPVIVEATLLSVSVGAIAVRPAGAGADLSLRLDPATVYELQDAAAAATDLRVGQRLKVKYRVEPDGSLKAQKIEILAAPAVAFQLEGTLVAAGATTLRVRVRGIRESGTSVPALAGRTIVVGIPSGTTVTENGRAKRGAALAAGDRVHVTGLVSGAAFTAQQVRAQRIARKR